MQWTILINGASGIFPIYTVIIRFLVKTDTRESPDTRFATVSFDEFIIVTSEALRQPFQISFSKKDIPRVVTAAV